MTCRAVLLVMLILIPLQVIAQAAREVQAIQVAPASTAAAYTPPPAADSDPELRSPQAVLFMLLLLGLFAIVAIAFLTWLACDARKRGIHDVAAWLVLLTLTGPIGWIVYLLSRPQGEMGNCRHCGREKLQVLSLCPHCVKIDE